MKKKYVFEQQPFDYSIVIQGVSPAGKIVSGSYKPATAEQIMKLETELSCILPKEYKDFLLSVNGGMIDPKLASPSIDVVQTVNGNDWLSESNITVRFLYTLDESTLVQREKNEGAENRFLSALHLPTVNKHYYDAYAPNEEAMGLDSKKLVIIADSDDHYIALSCDDDMYGKVLAIDSGSYPEDYPAGVANTMFNVAILADSFDIFLKSIFYYTK